MRYSIVSGNAWIVETGGGYVWVSGATGIARAVWFSTLPKALAVSRAVRQRGKPIFIVAIREDEPRRELAYAITCGKFYLADEVGKSFEWKRCKHDVVIGADAAVLGAAAAIEDVVQMLIAERCLPPASVTAPVHIGISI